MSGIFTDNTANSRFDIVDNTLQDGTNTYNFVFTSTLNSSPAITKSVAFKVILVNPCLSTTI